jgi:hypothetical protein
VAPERASDASRDDRLGPEIISLFHRLNNQLGVILANSELLESKLVDDAQRVRAAQVVTGALEAIGTVQNLKRAVGVAPADSSKTGN